MLAMIRILLFCNLLAVAVVADDWPQWLGPHRDDVWNETGVLDKFPQGGPKVLWRAPLAGGYSGPAVAGGKVYVTDFLRSSGEGKNDPASRVDIRGRERVLCLRASDGQELWKHEYDCPYKISYPSGPRTTPTIAGGNVYTLGAEGDLLCLDAETGKPLWAKNLKKEYKIESPHWGFCGHPLVDGDRLYCLAGGNDTVAVCFDRNTGRELWHALSSTPDAGYCPPKLIQAGGTKQLLIWHSQSLNSLNPDTGEVYWSQKLDPQYGMSCSTPQQSGDYLYVSAIGKCAAVLRLDRQKPAANIVWTGNPTTGVFCSNSTPAIDGETIYGNDCEVGNLRAVNLLTGKRLWETFKPTTGGERRESHGTAFITKHGDRYFLFSETGDLIIARLTPQDYEEISRAHLLEPTNEAFGRPVVWNHPAYANRCVFVRNDKEMVCASLAK